MPQNSRSLLFMPLLYVMTTLSIGLGMVSFTVAALSRPELPSPDPFSAYANIFPGQPERAIGGLGFSCASDGRKYYGSAQETRCQLDMAAGSFSNIAVTTSEGVIREIRFAIRDDTLRVGDLAVLLKLPDFQAHRMGYGASFSWNGRIVLALVGGETETFSHFRAVRWVKFADTPLPG